MRYRRHPISASCFLMRVSYILSHCLRFRHTPDLFFWTQSAGLGCIIIRRHMVRWRLCLFAFFPSPSPWLAPCWNKVGRFMISVALSPRIYLPINRWDKCVGTRLDLPQEVRTFYIFPFCFSVRSYCCSLPPSIIGSILVFCCWFCYRNLLCCRLQPRQRQGH